MRKCQTNPILSRAAQLVQLLYTIRICTSSEKKLRARIINIRWSMFVCCAFKSYRCPLLSFFELPYKSNFANFSLQSRSFVLQTNYSSFLYFCTPETPAFNFTLICPSLSLSVCLRQSNFRPALCWSFIQGLCVNTDALPARFFWYEKYDQRTENHRSHNNQKQKVAEEEFTNKIQ